MKLKLSFTGVLNRTEFFLRVLALLALGCVIAAIAILPLALNWSDLAVFSIIALDVIVLAIPTLLFSLSFQVRRMHDIGGSGWWILLGFIPGVSLFFALFEFFMPGTKGMNKYNAQMAMPAMAQAPVAPPAPPQV